ncbi:hypothetical protein F4803DRAFT_534364 [Xylaria telfairii]|nr:hypothetical protein F4803DRAFT_534364 [Xylaria telfairii]
MAATFHPFPRLPAELRQQIWSLAAGPRILHISVLQTSPSAPTKYTSPIPPPAMMHACQESRQHAPYQKAFFSSRHVYIWVNFQHDMICLADDKVEQLAPHYATIQRLRFTAPKYESYFYETFWRHSREIFGVFSALRELHVAVEVGYLIWGASLKNVGFTQCLKENTRFIDLHTGLMLNIPQIEMTEKWSDHQGGKVLDLDDFDYELQWVVDGNSEFDLSEFAEMD